MDQLTFVDVVGLLDTPQTSSLSSVAMCRYGLLLHKSYLVWSACAAVLALAYGTSMDELTFVGVVGLLDPPRDGIQDAVLTLLSTGAHLKMVTGDAEETALAIGKPHTHWPYSVCITRLLVHGERCTLTQPARVVSHVMVSNTLTLSVFHLQVITGDAEETTLAIGNPSSVLPLLLSDLYASHP